MKCQITPCSLGLLFWLYDVQAIHWVTLAQGYEEGWDRVARRYHEPLGQTEGRAPSLWQGALLSALETPLLPRPIIPMVIQGTAFQRAVWQALVGIPAGQVRTYAEVARQIGYPLASRGVGGACGANPLPFLVPCHRVVGSHGVWGGFGLGLPIKETLLIREGVVRHRTIPLSARARIPLL